MRVFFLNQDGSSEVAQSFEVRNFCWVLNPACNIFFHGTTMVLFEMQNMWDWTPDTDLLLELPEEYTFETALADLIVSLLTEHSSISFVLFMF